MGASQGSDGAWPLVSACSPFEVGAGVVGDLGAAAALLAKYAQTRDAAVLPPRLSFVPPSLVLTQARQQNRTEQNRTERT